MLRRAAVVECKKTFAVNRLQHAAIPVIYISSEKNLCEDNIRSMRLNDRRSFFSTAIDEHFVSVF